MDVLRDESGFPEDEFLAKAAARQKRMTQAAEQSESVALANQR
jgi:hypothetical protein